MIKKSLLLTLLLALLVPWAANAQTTVEIGDGTATCNTNPIGTYYNYSITEQLYTAEEIGMAGTISSISFYYMGTAAKDLPITVYMKHADEADLASAGISLADADEVFAGTLSVTTTAGWVTINLATPFAYDGTSNLLIGCIKDYLYYFSGQTWQGTATSATMARYTQNDNNAYTTSNTPSTAQANRPNIQIVITPSSGPTCDKPETFEVSNITTTGAVFTWKPTGAESYTFEYKKASDTDYTVVTGLTGTTYTLNTLTPGTSYSARVKAVCGASLESGYKSATFMTGFGIPFTEAFASTSVPAGWARYIGLLDEVSGGTALSTTTYGWSFSTGNGVFDNHAKINNYSTGHFYWLVTPAITMEDNVQLSFDLALTKYSGNLQPVVDTLQSDDKFDVLIATIDTDTTWTVLRQWDNQGSPYVYNEIACTAVGQNITIDLSSYAGRKIAIAFYAESTNPTGMANTGGDNNLHVDNVSIDYIPACAVPTGLANADVTARSAKLSWTSEATEWVVAYKKTADSDFTEITGVTENPYVLTGLTPETAYTAKVKANCGGTYSDWSATTSFTTGVACPVPTAVTASEIATTTAKIGWTSGASEWVVAYKVATDTDFTEITGVTENPYVLTGLTSNTNYNVKVKAVCGGEDGESEWTSNTTFTTAEECPTGMVCIGTGTATSSYVPANNYYNYSLTEQIYTAAEIGQAGAINSIDFFKASTTTMEKELDIYIVSTTKDEFAGTSDWIPVTASDLVYSGTVTFVDNDWTTITLDNPFIYDGTSNIAIVVDNNTGDYESSTNFRVFSATKNQALYQYNDNTDLDPTAATIGTANGRTTSKNRIRIAIGEPPACAKPTGLTVNYTGGTEAEVSWTSTASAWNMQVNGTAVTGTITNPYTLTGLDLATNYTVEVQADCGGATSDWASTSFTTDMCLAADMCAVTIKLTDSYGDGWNGGKLEVVDVLTSAVLGTYTLSSGGEETFTLDVCNGRDINFVYTQGSYPTENGWLITDINDDVIAEHEGCSSGCQVASGILATYTVNCTVTNCKTPTDLAASEIANHSAKLSWTENGIATEWVVAYSEDGVTFTEVNAATNPYTLTGLDPETPYMVKVRPVCSDFDNKWSTEIIITTDVACPAPTFGTITATPVSATVNWTGFASEYELEYAEVGTAKTGSGIWLQYDNNSNTNNIGNSTAATWTWGVMYPAAMLQLNNTLTKVGIYENSSYWTSDYTVNIYSGGDDAPGTLVGTETVTPSGSGGIHEVTLSAPVTIDPTKNLWITVTLDGTYVMAACTVAEPNNQWVNNGGSWANIGDLSSSLAGLGWMIRGYVEGYDASAYSWLTESGITSPFTIDGLDPETMYAVKVKALCGGTDGESEWNIALFTTPSNCAAPFDLKTTEVMIDNATVSWDGYQDSYNLQYRTAGQLIPVFEDDFENGIGSGWTNLSGENAELVSGQTTAWYTINPTSGLSFESHGGDYCASSWSWNSSAYQANNWLITPQIDLQGILRYYVRTLSSYPDSYEVLLSTTDADTLSFTVTLQALAPAPTTDNWEEVIIDLSAYAGQQGYIAIHHLDYDMNYLCIDDFGVYQVVNPGTWSDLTVNDAKTTQITGLTTETLYEFQVQGINSRCTGGLTDWSTSGFFTTLADEPIAVLDGGDWNQNSTWINSGGVVPPAGTDVYISGDVIIPAGYTAVAGEITIVNGGSLTIEEGGELQHTEEVELTMNMSINGYSSKSGATGYHLIAAPIDPTVAVASTGLATSTFDLYYFDLTQEGQEWRNYEAAPSQGGGYDLEIGKGYLYATSTVNNSIKFAGSTIPTDQNFQVSLTYDDSKTWKGWNLVGNPFTCTAYIGQPFYRLNSDGSEVNATTSSGAIAALEGVFVEATATGQYCTFSSTSSKLASALNITVNQGNAKVDNAILCFNEGSNLEKFQLNPSHTKVYMPVDGKDYAVATAENEGEMPVNFKAEENGTYTLSFNNENVEFGYLHLIDNKTGADVDLLATPSYSFEASNTDYASRFKLVFATGNNDNQFAFINNGEIILNGINGNTTVQLFDITGRIISSTNGVSRISTENMAAGVYMLRLINGENVKTQKIVVK